MSLAARSMQPVNIMTLSFAPGGWTNKVLEITSVDVAVELLGSAPEVKVRMGVHKAVPEVYEWRVSEELPSTTCLPRHKSTTPPPYRRMAVLSNAATALVDVAGIVRPRMDVTWDTPEDAYAVSLQLQVQAAGATAWTDAGSASGQSNLAYIDGIVAGQTYNVQIRSVRASGAASDWVEVDGTAVGLVLSVFSQSALDPGSLIGQAFGDGTAEILVAPFTATVGSTSVSVLPNGAVITGLQQGVLYSVYYVDPGFAGGNVSPIATISQTDYLGKVGYFLVDSIITPTAASSSGGSGGTGTSGGGQRYMPSAYRDLGSRTTRTPAAAYDGDLSTVALVGASSTSSGTTGGDVQYSGLPSVKALSTTNINVRASFSATEDRDATCSILVDGGTSIFLADLSDSATSNTYTASIPAGTDLSSLVVEIEVDTGAVAQKDETGLITATCSVAETWITL